jgi:hypothetical protein
VLSLEQQSLNLNGRPNGADNIRLMPQLLSRVTLVMIIVACGANTVVAPTTAPVPTPTTTPATTAPTPGPQNPVYDGLDASTVPEGMTLVARVKGETVVYTGPTLDEPLTTLPESTILGTDTVLAILDGPVDGWARVMLPIRPNGAEGWIQTDNTDIFVVGGRVVVDLSERELTVYRGGKVILTSPVAIGTSRNPTPTGTFFVTDSVTLTNPNSPWGPRALGLSGRSETITEYNGGDGIIGIHGTNRPGSIGHAASLGCVRLPNDVMVQVHKLVPIGTPVEIRA